MKETRSVRYLAACQLLVLQPALVMFATPQYFGALARDKGFTETQLATVGSVEALSAALVVVCLSLLADRVSPRAAGTIGAVLLTVATLGCIKADTMATLLPMRVLVGTGVSVVASVTNVYIAATRVPERWFGWQMTLSTLLVMGGVVVLPRVEQQFGLTGFYVVLVVLAPVTLWAIRVLPAHATPPPERAPPPGPRAGAGAWWNPAAILALLALLLYAGYVYPTYNFSERMGTMIGLTPVYIGGVLSITTPIGLLGSLFASASGDRFGTVMPLAVCAILAAGGAAALMEWPSVGGFWIAMAAMSFVFNYAQPYLCAEVARADRDGRFVYLIGPVQDTARGAVMLLLAFVLERRGIPGAAALGASLMVGSMLVTAVGVRLMQR